MTSKDNDTNRDRVSDRTRGRSRSDSARRARINSLKERRDFGS